MEWNGRNGSPKQRVSSFLPRNLQIMLKPFCLHSKFFYFLTILLNAKISRPKTTKDLVLTLTILAVADGKYWSMRDLKKLLAIERFSLDCLESDKERDFGRISTTKDRKTIIYSFFLKLYIHTKNKKCWWLDEV